MPEILGAVAILVGEQGLRNRRRTVRNAKGSGIAAQQFAVNGFDQIGDGVGLADHAGLAQPLLQPGDVAQDFGAFEDLVVLGRVIPLRNQRQIGHVGAAEMFVEHPVCHPDGVLGLEPLDRVIVDADQADAITGGHHHDHGNHQHRPGVADHALAEATQPAPHDRILVRVPGGVTEAGEPPLRHQHDVSRNEGHRAQPGQEHTNRDKDAEHLNGRDRGECQ